VRTSGSTAASSKIPDTVTLPCVQFQSPQLLEQLLETCPALPDQPCHSQTSTPVGFAVLGPSQIPCSSDLLSGHLPAPPTLVKTWKASLGLFTGTQENSVVLVVRNPPSCGLHTAHTSHVGDLSSMVSLPSFTVSASSGALARTHSLRAIARWCSELGVQPPLIEVANPAASLSAVGASPLLVAAPYFGEILSAPPFETVSDASSFSSWIAVALPNALALVPITLLGSDSEIQQQCHACRLACTTFNSQHLSTQFFQPDESAPPTTPPTWWHTLSLKDATCQELLRCLLNSSAEFTNYSARVGS
jgi:hypothetical protein